MNSSLLLTPVSEPVSLAEAKAWLRLDTSDEDTLVTNLIVAVRRSIEDATRRLLIAQTWRLRFDTWPTCVVTSPLGNGATVSMPSLPIPLAPIAAITALRVYDAADVPQTIATAQYRLCGAPDDARLLFSAAPPNPGRAAGGIELDVVAGYGAPADVPQPLRQAILNAVAALFENRGDTEGSPGILRGAAGALIAPYRRVRLA